MDLERAVAAKTFINVSDADFAAAQLRSSGIECVIAADDAAGAYPGLALIRLLVDLDRVNEARQVLNEAPVFEASQLEPNPASPLSSANTPPPTRLAGFGWGLLAGAVIGAILHWSYLKREGFGQHRLRYDNDRDGMVELETVWKDGEIIESKSDRNADGRVDFRSYFEAGIQIKDELDLNFDGTNDLWHTLDQRGNYSTARFDADFNGIADAISTFKDGIAVQTDWQPNGTNVITLRQILCSPSTGTTRWPGWAGNRWSAGCLAA